MGTLCWLDFLVLNYIYIHEQLARKEIKSIIIIIIIPLKSWQYDLPIHPIFIKNPTLNSPSPQFLAISYVRDNQKPDGAPMTA